MSPAGAGSRAEHKVTPVPVFPGLSGFSPKSPGQTRIVVILEAFPQGQESPREKRRGSWRGREKEGPKRQTIWTWLNSGIRTIPSCRTRDPGAGLG